MNLSHVDLADAETISVIGWLLEALSCMLNKQTKSPVNSLILMSIKGLLSDKITPQTQVQISVYSVS